MCDYSLEHYASRPAQAGEDLSVTRMGSGCVGLKVPDATDCVACVSEGTILRLQIPSLDFGFSIEDVMVTKVNPEHAHTYHDAVRTEAGDIVTFQHLCIGTKARVLMVADAKAPEDVALANPAPEAPSDSTPRGFFASIFS